MLYICATPIGNLKDISLRVLDTLKEVDVIAAEDTRQTVKLLNHYEIKKPMIAYHEHNRFEMTPVLVDRMLRGENIALVTDAGTPVISDPGEDLVRACIESGVEVTSLPGATAFTTALTLSGMNARRFTFEGFLPKEKNELKGVLDRFRESTVTTIFYEAPHRLVKTLEKLADAVGEKDRKITVCKELTKKHEWSMRFDSIAAAGAFFREKEEPRGEFVLVIEGCDSEEMERDKQQEWEKLSVEEHMKIYLEKGVDKKEAMKAVAKDRGVSKRDIYQALLELGG
ncbi:MAG: 16S rRNA (cytidine(1402)-2'-O)-methyltransferase [Eubacterium sp.]|nr:16S rRNA (cytidine(1402)-2'-O)-methyltransferase [Eubacterium sp.]